MRLLAFDTCLSACQAALLADGEVLARQFAAPVRDHAERLLPMLRTLLEEAGMALADLDGLVLTVGPGSFTGVRAGVAAARGLRLACGLPLLGLNSLEAVAAALSPADFPALVVHDARRGEAYAQAFDAGGAAEAAPRLLRYEVLAELAAGRRTLAGSGAATLRAQGQATPGIGPALPDPTAWWPVARRAMMAESPAPALSPLYVRAPDARLPAPR